MSEDLMLPHNAELIHLDDPHAVAHALNDIRSLEARMREVKAILTAALVEESKRQGSKTLHLVDVDVEVRGGTEVDWDIERLRFALTDAGLPDERLEEVIRATVTYKVDAREAKRIGAANADYAEIVEVCRTVREKDPYIVIRRGK